MEETEEEDDDGEQTEGSDEEAAELAIDDAIILIGNITGSDNNVEGDTREEGEEQDESENRVPLTMSHPYARGLMQEGSDERDRDEVPERV